MIIHRMKVTTLVPAGSASQPGVAIVVVSLTSI